MLINIFWFTDWQAYHPKGVRSLCGSYTVINDGSTDLWLNSGTHLNGGYFCSSKVLTSEDSYSEFKETEIKFIINGSGS